MDVQALETQLKEQFAPQSRWVVALSGGADSVALLRLLCSFREERSLTVFAAHVHHGLRTAANADLRFVRRLCRELDVPLYSTRIQADEAAKQQGTSLEAAGRACRYAFLLPLAKRLNARVVTAHTLNDQAETMLLYLTRGNGPEGLAGIRETREDGVFRPLLTVTKETLLSYLKALGQPHCEDESNRSEQFLRNRIRNQVLPILTDCNPAFLRGIARTAELLQTENDYLKEQTEAILHTAPDGIFGLRDLQALHTAILRRVIRLAAKRFSGENNLATTETEAVLNLIRQGTAGKRRPLGTSGLVRICNETVNFSKTVEKPEGVWYNITVPASVSTPWGTISLTVTTKRPESGLVLDADQVGEHLLLRTRADGDRIRIADEKHQKVSDLLINRKVRREERAKTLLLCDGDAVLAVIPFRVAYHAAATETTARFLVIQRSDCDESH